MKTWSADAIEAMANHTAIVTGALTWATDPVVRIWGGYGDITIGGNLYKGVGDVGLVGSFSLELGGTENGIEYKLNGINPEIMAAVANDDVRGAAVLVERWIFNETGTTFLDGKPFFRGRCHNVRMHTTAGEAYAIFEIEGSARGLNRAGGRIANDQDQRLIDPTDDSMERVSTVPFIMLYWLDYGPARAGPTVNGGRTGFGRFGSVSSVGGGSPGGGGGGGTGSGGGLNL